MYEATSKTLKRVTELTHLAPLKQGFVPGMRTITYGARLKLLLGTLFKLRENRTNSFESPLDRLRLVHFARWVVLGDPVQGDRELLFTSNFDGAWETYIGRFVDEIPALLNLIWSHCEGYGRDADDYTRFSSWVRNYQVDTAILYASHPDLTVLDIEWLRQFKSKYDDALQKPGCPFHDGPSSADLAALRALPAKVHVPQLSKAALPVEAWATFLSLLALFEEGERQIFFEAIAEFINQRGNVAGVVRVFEYARRVPLRDREATRAEIERLLAPQSAAAKSTRSVAPQAVETAGLQSIVARSYDKLAYGRLVFLAIDDPEKGRAWLENLITEIHFGAEPPNRTAVSVGFSFRGLRALGLSASVLSELPKEFRDGMAQRAAILGDVGDSHPALWTLPAETVDAVVMLYAASPDRLKSLEKHMIAQCALPSESEGSGVWRVTAAQELERRPDGSEHFGFKDGLSQPTIAGLQGTHGQKAGDFLLGYENERGDVAGEKFLQRLGAGAGSTFLVLRKFEQHVKRLEHFLNEAAEQGIDRNELASRMLGRNYDGSTLDGRSELDFGGDPHGKVCPFQSHVRRANPQTPGTPRLLRRGMSYKEGDGRCGLVFMAINANIAAQFELIQSWINGANVSGSLSSDNDPLLGTRERGAGAASAKFQYFVGEEVRLVSLPPEPFVTLRWGLYLLLPSRSALEAFIKQAPQPKLEAPNLLTRVAQLPTPEARKAAIKRLLEQIPTARETAPVIWAEVRAKGAAETPYGVLVSGAEQGRHVLGDDRLFSVCEYAERMRSTTGPFYLGMDAPEHAQFAEEPNSFIRHINPYEVYIQASVVTKDFIQRLQPDRQGPVRLRGPELVDQVIEKIASAHFGVPPGDGDRKWLEDAQIAAQYIFYPNPEEFVVERAQSTGAKQRYLELVKRTAKWLASSPPDSSLRSTLLKSLLQSSSAPESPSEQERIASTLAGVVSGFVVPTKGTFISVLSTWIKEGMLSRVQSLWRNDKNLWSSERLNALPNERHPLLLELVRAMQRQPVPSLLYRRTKDVCTIDGVTIASGATVVVDTSVQMPGEGLDARVGLMFGTGAHACPGRNMAFATLLGMLTPVLDRSGLRAGAGSSDVAFDA